MNKYFKSLGLYAVLFIIVLTVLATVNQNYTAPESVTYTYTDMVEKIENGEVSEVAIERSTEISDYGTVTATLKDGKFITMEIPSATAFTEYAHEKAEEGALKVTVVPIPKTSMLSSILPSIILMIVAIVIFSFMMQKMQGGGKMTSFGKSKAKVNVDEKNRVTFENVAGCDEEKAELQELVDFLKEPTKYTDLGARIPKGVLLVGPPGTGKTLLAKAVAGEAKVQFLSISGSDFVELYVGVGASRVRDLFEQAKKSAPAIVFIDEIDAVGRQRGSGLGGGHDEREQTLNQLLVEMDGFTANEGVIVVAATNRADILDSALLRPGRFDRTVYVGLPDVKGREDILKVHARNKILGDDVDLASLAKGTPGFTGADLENLLNEGALLAARRGKKFITMAELDEAILKVQVGPEKKSRKVPEKARRLTAYHEAGHAVSAYWLDNVDPVHQITIIPRGPAGGMTIYRPTEDKTFSSKSEMFERIVTALGGRIAEKLFLDDISTGASSDIQQASAIARAMVTKYGMSESLGPISYDSSDQSIFIGRDFAATKSYSEKVASQIDDEVRRIFAEAEKRCEDILTEHKDVLITLAEYLLEHETMEGEDFAKLCSTGKLPEADEKEELPEAVEELPESDNDNQ